MAEFRNVHYNNYMVSRSGIVVRIKPERGTYVGKQLKPYKAWNSGEMVVKLHHNGKAKQVMLKHLIARVF